MLQKPDVASLLTKWVLELNKFNIKVTTAKAIKGQALADFVAELTPEV